jgi:hypothetical protein
MYGVEGSRMKMVEWSKKNRADRQLEKAAREGTLQVSKVMLRNWARISC